MTLTGTNTFNGNGDAGLIINSKGSISVSNLTAKQNSLQGAWLKNDVPTFAGTVTVSGFGSFTNNSNIGLKIESLGAVTLAQLTAIDNASNGVDVDNHLALSAQAVTITGLNTFFSNSGDGLQVDSRGAITVNSITASENSTYGAYLRNNYSGTSAVTITGVNTFLSNLSAGLYILSLGNVSATKVTADGNVGGMYVSTPGNVTLTCGNFANDGAYGLRVDGGGGISLLKLIGVFSSGNTVNINTSLWTGTISTIRNCP